MYNSKKTNAVNMYAQGSIWLWAHNDFNGAPRKAGVQSGTRPVIIISNDDFNISSPVVNCLTITSTLNASPVHVQIVLDNTSHIQCEQPNTIPKTELVEYRGVVSALILSQVKSKLRVQFDMNADRGLEVLLSLKSGVDTLLERTSGNAAPDAVSDMLLVLNNIYKTYTDIQKSVAALACYHGEDGDNAAAVVDTPQDTASELIEPVGKERVKKGVHRKYTDDDKLFILDKTNSVEDVMSRFDYKDRKDVYRMRTYFKKRLEL